MLCANLKKNKFKIFEKKIYFVCVPSVIPFFLLFKIIKLGKLLESG